ncbi:methyltransferase [Vibrio fortis]|uniref:Methyltransferase n=1 Tax=Vibrio fortis TaxID=212667 RepID=A0A066UR24_9VIBR|nr:class I SAM-dependent methyltransferase [Vibrio fortis]KDN26589.1 methyltransferase [Vibrio fortis]
MSNRNKPQSTLLSSKRSAARKPMAQQDMAHSEFHVPSNLIQPLWFRSRESLADDGLVYDPIAAQACTRCRLAPECLTGELDQQQLLYATLTQLCDNQIQQYLSHNPEAWIINVGAGLDTRFYRLDNGRCHWVELDVTENLVWRQRLFHKNERYRLECGSVNDLTWLDELNIPEQAPVLIVCEHALLDCDEQTTAHFIQALSRQFTHAHACLVLAGDKTSSKLGQKLGSGEYAHGLASPVDSVLNWLPWTQWVKAFSPLDQQCNRWKLWQRMLSKLTQYKKRLAPQLIVMKW